MNSVAEPRNSVGEFRWLHLSDLHVGMTDQDWLWPTFKHSIFTDMQLLLPTVGPWDLVIFSGDLTQRGTIEEFEKLDAVLSELWGKFKTWGLAPQLIALPGNHDVFRANSLTPELRLLKRWWEEPEIHREFFTGETNPYRVAVDSLFKPYSSWRDRGFHGIEMLRGKRGLLPGDESYSIQKEDLNIGLVTLNSTWLQLDGSDYERKLHVDTKQLLAVTENDPDSWCQRHSFNIIVTHHPTSWLHDKSRSYWLSDINPPGRFDLHVFGHLHVAQANSESSGGSLPRNSIQGASTFGIEYTKEGVERIHGYSIAQLSSRNQKELRLWPRRLRKLASGDRKLGPNLDFDLALDNSVMISLGRKEPTKSTGEVIHEKKLGLGEIALPYREVLRKFRYYLHFSPAHANVRRVEQRRLMEMISDGRAAWLVAEWGMGDDNFLASVRRIRGDFDRPTYRLDLTEYRTRDHFLNGIAETMECSFQQFCELLSQEGNCFLLLDNFPAGIYRGYDHSSERDVEELVRVVLEYCPDLWVLIRSRHRPLAHELPLVQLRSLDEADLRTYIQEHERGRDDLTSETTISALLRHTDGVPAFVDRALKELEVTSLSELVNTDSGFFSGHPVGGEESAPTLAKAIQELAKSTDPARLRSFSLLKVLSLFPQGELLSRIKRFNPTAPFFPAHATELLDRSLIEASTMQVLDFGEAGSPSNTLVVPRPIRETVREMLNTEEMSRMNRRAAELYFGPHWSTGTYRLATAYKFDEPHCGIYEIVNAGTIIIRLLREAISINDKEPIARVLGLADFYLDSLEDGDHFHSIAVFCDELVPIIPATGFEDKLASMRSYQAASLRMIGEEERARSIISEIIDFPMSKSKKQGLLVELAYCHEDLEEEDEAKSVAKRILELDPHSTAGLQARALLIELDEDDPRRTDKLAELEGVCRKEGAEVAANNIALMRADEAEGDPNKIREILRPVVKRSKDNTDYYNRMRAEIMLAELSVEGGGRLDQKSLGYLIDQYHFLFNERMSSYFDRCHAVLWRCFESSHDISNLLILFRLSSLCWRLRGKESDERIYLKKLARTVSASISERLTAASREAAYYLVRASSELSEAPVSSS